MHATRGLCSFMTYHTSIPVTFDTIDIHSPTGQDRLNPAGQKHGHVVQIDLNTGLIVNQATLYPGQNCV